MFSLTCSTLRYNVVGFGDFFVQILLTLWGGGVKFKTHVYMYFYLSFTILDLTTFYLAYQIEKKVHIFLIFVSISYIIMVHVDSHRKYYKLLI